ncbi:hypothetical protein [Rubritalea marina]|uniref:hypothetical protein n=1 Tax=Rubritalea marina TaxID=361055 RepID=UPI00035EA856|nr:hypothetical protein [Rubritalea marina]
MVEQILKDIGREFNKLLDLIKIQMDSTNSQAMDDFLNYALEYESLLHSDRAIEREASGELKMSWYFSDIGRYLSENPRGGVEFYLQIQRKLGDLAYLCRQLDRELSK